MKLDDVRRRSKDKTPLVTKIIVHDPDGGNAFDLLEETRQDREFLLDTIDRTAKNLRSIRNMLPSDVNDCKETMTPFMIGVIEGLLSTIEDEEQKEEEENAWESFFPDWTKRHPFTCGECSWGRDGAYHDYEEYRIHMATRHKPQGEYCDEKEECDLQSCPEHPHHDYNTNEHTWEQHHDRTEHCPPEETDLCKCDAYDGWGVDDLEKIERALGEIDKHPVLAGKDAYVKLSDVKDAIRKALGR